VKHGTVLDIPWKFIPIFSSLLTLEKPSSSQDQVIFPSGIFTPLKQPQVLLLWFFIIIIISSSSSSSSSIKK
jgi:hypothetical protein